MKYGPDDQLLRFPMDHASRVRSADAFGTRRHTKLGVDLVQLVRTAGSPVWRIGDQPQLSRPRDDRADAALAVLLRPGIVEDREVRIDAADLQELGLALPLTCEDCDVQLERGQRRRRQGEQALVLRLR